MAVVALMLMWPLYCVGVAVFGAVVVTAALC